MHEFSARGGGGGGHTALLSLIAFSMQIQTSPMSSYSSKGDRRPKRKTYHRVPELDKSMDLPKKPAQILRLKSLISASKTHSILVRNLEKEVGFVQKWNFFSLIQRYPTIFKVSGDGAARAPTSVGLTDKAERISINKAEARALMEPILVKKVRKMLMMSLDCRIPLDKFKLIESDLGLLENFKDCFIPKYPQLFSVKNVDEVDHLFHKSWDSSLAVTAREERLDLVSSPMVKKKAIVRD